MSKQHRRGLSYRRDSVLLGRPPLRPFLFATAIFAALLDLPPTAPNDQAYRQTLGIGLYSGSPVGVDQGTIAKWLFHREKAALNPVRKAHSCRRTAVKYSESLSRIQAMVQTFGIDKTRHKPKRLGIAP